MKDCLVNTNQFLLRFREELTTLSCDENIFFKTDLAIVGGGHIELQREHVTHFNNAHRAFSITFPFRTE